MTRTAIVTGASSGIGAGIARAFGARGWSVGLGARRADRLEAVAAEVESAGGRALAHPLDVREPASVDAFFTATERGFGPVDLVVSNAGLGRPGLLHEIAIDEIRLELDTNLLGPILIARRAIPAMIERGQGDLVFISSMNVIAPRPMQLGYTASKAGVEGVAQTLRMDLEGTGVRSIIVRPGPTKSEFGVGWEPQALERLIASWQRWGFLRHWNILESDAVAAAVVGAVDMPAEAIVDIVQVTPAEPKPDK